MSGSSRPRDSRNPLRKVFDGAEKAVATRTEPLAQSGGFAKTLGLYVAANRKVIGTLGSAATGLLHLVRIPTTRDVGKLHQHLATVDSHLAELIHELDQHALKAQGAAGSETAGSSKAEIGKASANQGATSKAGTNRAGTSKRTAGSGDEAGT
jgi:hypothetical protein